MHRLSRALQSPDREPVRDAGGGDGLRHRLTVTAAAAWLAVVALLAAPGFGIAGAPDQAGADWTGEIVALDTSRASLDGQWVVLEAVGETSWRPQGNARWQVTKAGQVVPAGSEIQTGPFGGVTLVVGGDRLVVASDSRLVLPVRSSGDDQRLRHERGRMRVDIERRSGRDVRVRTPLLSLGIKGTSFEVAVDRLQNSVLVLEGLVTVTRLIAAPPIDLGPRQGLRQPADLTVEPVALEFADLPATTERTEPVRWHLPAPAVSPSADTEPAETSGTRAPDGSAEAGSEGSGYHSVTLREGSDTTGTTRQARDWLGGWVDHETSLFTVFLIAVGGLVVLLVPGLVLGQNLRQHWLDRPGGRGRRRRSMVRDG